MTGNTPATLGTAARPVNSWTPPVSSLGHLLAHHGNDYAAAVTVAACRLPVSWHAATPHDAAAGTAISVIVATRDHAATLPAVLDSVAAQRTAGEVEVIVVDAASRDDSARIAARHPVTRTVIQLPHRTGIGAARNVGILAARTATIVTVAATMRLANHVLADFAARTGPDLALLGFHQRLTPGMPVHADPDLDADPRVRWQIVAGQPLPRSGRPAPRDLLTFPMHDTNDLRDLGHGRRYLDLDLPSMLDTRLCAIPRRLAIGCGGFPATVEAGGVDRVFAARLIAAGCHLVPVQAARGHDLTTTGTVASTLPTYHADRQAQYARILTMPHRPTPLTSDGETSYLYTEATHLK